MCALEVDVDLLVFKQHVKQVFFHTYFHIYLSVLGYNQ